MRRSQGWEPLWAGLDAVDEYWRTPDAQVLAWAGSLQGQGGRRVLDLGCGVGRHTVALSRVGLDVTGSDVSPSGLAACAAWLAREGLHAALVRHEMETLPFRDAAFDALLALNVVYHAPVAGVRRVLAEVRRVLRPGGWFGLTLIGRLEQNVALYRAGEAAGEWREIEPFTFVRLDEAGDDRHLPHHYVDEAEARAFLEGFDVIALRPRLDEGVREDGTAWASLHYWIEGLRRG